LISLLVPTRKRPEKFKRMALSALATAEKPIEILAYVTWDDEESKALIALSDEREIQRSKDLKVIVGKRRIMSDLWNALLPHATGDIFMQCADDVVFRTPCWDRYVEEAFAAVPDKILLAFANDGSPNGERFATLPFVHRRWTQTIGYFTGPGFAVDFSDTWPFDVATMVGRVKYLPLLIEHEHWVWNKAQMDETYKEVNEIRQRDDCSKFYADRLPERQADAEKLRKVML
jgi:hypothetical protein